MPLVEQFRDVLDPGAHVLLHQTNCQTTYAAGVAAAIFERYPEADCYSSSKGKGKNGKGDRRPGTVDLRRISASKMTGKGAAAREPASVGQPLAVANLFGQDAPGKPGRSGESAEAREQYFKSGLKEFEAKLLELPEVERRVGLGKGGRSLEGMAVQARMLRSEGPEKEPEETLVIAVPKNIGCGLAGGTWAHYEGFLRAFDASLSKKVALEVRVCKRPMRCAECGQEPLEENVDGWDSRGGFYCNACWKKWQKK